MRKPSLPPLMISMMLALCLLPWQRASAVTETTADSGGVRQRYFQSYVGSYQPILRDYATSPLFYNGSGLSMGIGWLKRSPKQERSFLMQISGAMTNAAVPESNFLEASASGYLLQFGMRHQRLWTIKKLNTGPFVVKAGGALFSDQNIRVNPSLQNNAGGFENITNLMVAGQVSMDLSRKSERTIDLFVVKRTLRPVQRHLRLLMNVGVFNFNFRPGYSYTYESELTGKTVSLLWIFSNYKWSMNGYRLHTELEYFRQASSGNAYSWSYVWDAAHVSGRYEAMQLASHQIKYTLYFRTRKDRP